jgi:hypothetical protein
MYGKYGGSGLIVRLFAVGCGCIAVMGTVLAGIVLILIALGISLFQK